jgi:hypothetical protein
MSNIELLQHRIGIETQLDTTITQNGVSIYYNLMYGTGQQPDNTFISRLISARNMVSSCNNKTAIEYSRYLINRKNG